MPNTSSSSLLVAGIEYKLGLPHLFLGRLSDDWLMKEAGHLHWQALCDDLSTPSHLLKNRHGQRLLSSFLRVRYESISPLDGFGENDVIQVSGDLSRFGSNRYLSDFNFAGEQRKIALTQMTSFIVRENSNQQFTPSSPADFSASRIADQEVMPPFAEEFHQLRRSVEQGGDVAPFTIHLGGLPFVHTAAVLFECEYEIVPHNDLNGLGLLYFASYPRVQDICEGRYIRSQQGIVPEDADWLQAAVPVARDVFYFHNCDPGDTIIYRLNRCDVDEQQRIVLQSTLYRKSDGQAIAVIFSLKQWSPHKQPAQVVAEQGENESVPAGVRTDAPLSAAGLTEMLARELSRLLACDRAEIDLNAPWSGYALDSVNLTELSAALEEQAGICIDPTALLSVSSTRQLAADILNKGKATPAKGQPQSPQRQPRQPVGTLVNPRDVAVIGMSARLPGAATVHEFWEHLVQGVDPIREIPGERWNWRQYFSESVEEGKTISKWGGFLDGIELFAAAHFKISAREARLMDPQQRLLLEETARLLESCGYAASTLRGSATGVYIGVSNMEYEALLNEHRIAEAYTSTGTALSIIPNRISYVFDWHGPSEAIDTACSSSLVAVHRAVRALQNGECSMAVAGGVNLCLTPNLFLSYSRAGMLSPRGRCRTFAKDADGYVRGEGVGVILLKPMYQAQRDGDPILAVIKATGTRHGGHTNSLTVPNVREEAGLIRKTWEDSGLDPHTAGYLELHGTGTPLGDPAEINAVKLAFAELRERCSHPSTAANCALGSVKTHIGHLESAAGIAGLITVILSMQHRRLPGLLHFSAINPLINLDDTPFSIAVQGGEWQRLLDCSGMDIPLRAGVSSFGFGGTYAHAVLEEYTTPPPEPADDGEPVLFVFSSASAPTLKLDLRELATFLEHNRATINPADLCYTLQIGRDPRPQRIAMVVSGLAQLLAALESFLTSGEVPQGMWQASGIEPSTTAKKNTRQQPSSLEELARRWTQGEEIDWEELYSNKTPHRLSLPARGLQSEAYWFKEHKQALPDFAAELHAIEDRLQTDQKQVAAYENEFIRLCALGTLRIFQKSGCYLLSDERYDFEHLRDRLAVLPKYERLLLAVLHSLVRAGFLEHSEDAFTTTIQVERPALLQDLEQLEQLKLDFLEVHPRAKVEVELWWTCLARFTEVIRGEVPATDVMFPDMSMELLQNIYNFAPFARTCNQWLGLLIAQHIAEVVVPKGSQKKIRILEIGAGTGASTSVLLPLLKPYADRLEYVYTDLSPAFLKYGARQFRDDYPFVRYQLLDLEKGYADQGCAAGSFNLIIGTNVIHAVRRIDRCVSDLRRLLKQDGRVIFNELTKTRDFHHLSFALLDGWWLFEDEGYRQPDSPLLSPDAWRRLLHDCGFTAVEVKGPESAIQHLLLGSNPDLFGGESTTAPSENLFQSVQATPPGADSIESLLHHLIAQVLEVDAAEIHFEPAFSEYGIDSILGMEFIKEINTALQIELKSTDIFDYPTIERLANFIRETCTPILPPPNTASPLIIDHHPPSPPMDRICRDIAIIGMSGRFPQAENPSQLWDNLCNGVCSISEIPQERWDHEAIFSPGEVKPGKSYGRWGGFLSDIDRFDPTFFNISGLEAAYMDPQQRLFLQEAWNCLEDAGYAPESLEAVRCGAYVASGDSGYLSLMESMGLPKVALSYTGNDRSILAARIAYLLNLRGPAIGVDTACSSSLVAVHMARQAILSGECDMALAGGVFVTVTPGFFVHTANTHMLAPDGRCKVFDEKADGFVPGEGVGVVLLKALDRALADGDPIHAVIKGSGINQDGKTNGITAPSGVAQTELVRSVYARHGIDADSIQYIECHGTGTQLGDYIEVNALINAFSQTTDRTQFCHLGSIKPNIGHTALAAGVTGLIKLILALKNRKIPQNLYFEQPNSRIAFEKSPFLVNTELTSWDRPETGVRRAAISAFGFSGTNCHMVLDEAPPPPSPALPAGQTEAAPCLFVLSAKSKERLTAYLQRFIDFLERPETSTLALQDLAYTLQIGRMPLKYRFACVVEDKATLLHTLRDALALDLNNTANAHSGEASPDACRPMEAAALEDASFLHRLAAHWCAGGLVDWRERKTRAAQRVHLPTYPFASEPYWLHPAAADGPGTLHANASIVVPLVLHQQDFFLDQHRLNSIATFPGAASIGALLEAAALAGYQDVQVIETIHWQRLVQVKDDQETLLFRFFPDKERIRFEIATGNAPDQTAISGSFRTGPQRTPPLVEDFDAFRTHCPVSRSVEAYYQNLAAGPLRFGPNFFRLQRIATGEKQVLTELSPPETGCAYPVHPNLLDAAFQTLDTLRVFSETNDFLNIPVRAQGIQIYAPLTNARFVAAQLLHADEQVRVGELSIVDDQHQLLLHIDELHLQRVQPGTSSPDTFYWIPGWRSQPLMTDNTHAPAPLPSLIHEGWLPPLLASVLPAAEAITCTTADAVVDTLGRYANASQPTALLIEGTSSCELTVAAAETAYIQLLDLIRRLHQTGLSSRPLHLLYLLPLHGDESPSATLGPALNACLRTLQMELPNLRCTLVELQRDALLGEDLIGLISGELQAEDGCTWVRYPSPRERRVQHWQAWRPQADSGVFAAAPEDTVLITGGAGKIGRLCAHSCAREFGCRIALIGRSTPDQSLRRFLETLNTDGSKAAYFRADLADKDQLEQQIEQIVDTLGPIRGVIHCAGTVQDAMTIRKTDSQWRAVFAAKVAGTHNLDQATRNQPLGFFLCCSSMASVIGNPGQSDYAFANGFLDAFAAQREQLKAEGQRNGVTRSICWPLWAEGGMKVPQANLQRMERSFGLRPMPTASGLAVLRSACIAPSSRIWVHYGLLPPLKKHHADLFAVQISRGREEQQPLAEVPLEVEVLRILSRITSDLLKIDPSHIQADTDFSEFGFDSILFTTFAEEINARFGLDLTPANLFEYATLESLAEYLLHTYAAALEDALRHNPESPPQSEPPSHPETNAPKQRLRLVQPPPSGKPEHEPIAIVGMALRFPGADDARTFWNDLLTEQTRIREIPPERWDWRASCTDGGEAQTRTDSRWGAFIEDIDGFDAPFFGIPAHEARLMDPQQRIFLEIAWSTIEDAGIRASDLWGSTMGVFVGAAATDYQELLQRDHSTIDAHIATGQAHSILANRISHFLNLHGPSMPVNTACSSALVAVHRAATAIRNSECELALAGGINTLLSPTPYRYYSKAGMLAMDGRCKSFDAAADGYVRGEGGGAILLKPLSQALADGNPIHGVLLGSAENHGGRVSSLTAPNPNAQAEVIRLALAQARVNPESISYIEAHGTGTALGDPIEINGLKKAFAKEGFDQGSTPYCGIGSVKTNIGHLETAAGIAGLIKVLLSMKHRILPGNVHLKTPNPQLRLEDSPFYLVERTRDWPQRPGVPLRAGISAFGFGGSNAHVIVEAPSQPTQTVVAPPPVLTLLSAKTEERLRVAAQRLVDFLTAEGGGVALVDLAYTLQNGRVAMEWRLAVVAESLDGLVGQLQSFLAGTAVPGLVTGSCDEQQATPSLPDPVDRDASPQPGIGTAGLERIGKLWTQGIDFAWDQLYHHPPRLLSLPTYPFARHRYWYTTEEKDSTSAPLPSQETPMADGQPEPITAVAPADPEEMLLELVSTVLGVDRKSIQMEDTLQDLGLDSFDGVNLAQQIEHRYRVHFSANLIYELSSLAEVAVHIRSLLPHPDPPSCRPPAAAERYPLSKGQQALWMLQQAYPQMSAYNIPAAYRVTGPLEVSRFQAALDTLLQLHPLLSATIRFEGDGPQILIKKPAAAVLRTENWDHVQGDAALRRQLETLAEQPFDLEQGPLMRCTLATLQDTTQILLLEFHHIICDGMSHQLFTDQLQRLYQSGGVADATMHPAADFSRFVQWQTAMLAGENGRQMRAFWCDKLQEPLPLLNLRTDFPIPRPATFRGAHIHLDIPAEMIEGLEQRARQENTTVFVLLLTAISQLLHLHSGDDDIIIGTPFSGRPQAEYQSVFGYFVNMLCLRNRILTSQTTREQIRQIRQTVQEAFAAALYPLSALQEDLQCEPRRLFRVAFYYHNQARENTANNAGEGLSLAWMPEIRQKGEFDLSFEYLKVQKQLFVKYNPDLFTEGTIRQLVAPLENLLQGICSRPEERLSDWDEPTADRPGGTDSPLLLDLFRAQARQRPEATAVVCNDHHQTYAALDRRSDQIAQALMVQGLGTGDHVGLFVNRSTELLPSLFGILKAGAAYVPLDTHYPVDRIDYMLSQAEVRCVLTDQDNLSRLPSSVARTMLVETCVAPSEGQPLPRISPNDIAYLIYTSGSTGKPKGIRITHGNLANFLSSMASKPGLTADDYVLALTTLCFDIAALELFLPLTVGGCVEVLTGAVTVDGLALARKVATAPVTMIQATPATYDMLEAAEWLGKPGLKILVGGEALRKDLAARLLQRGAAVWNMYGPTETTIWSSIAPVVDPETIGIGEPIARTSLHVLDAQQQPVAEGEIGELYIGGAGVSPGYWKRPDLNAQAFLADPFAGQGTMYRTGDLVRRTAQGRLEYLGRTDAQMKLNGFRIEAGDIEQAMLGIPGIEQAVACLREETAGIPQLTAFYVSSRTIESGRIRTHLQDHLPDYMLPLIYVRMREIPLTLNRKVDRKTLSGQALQTLLQQYGPVDLAPVFPADDGPGQQAALRPRLIADLLKLSQNCLELSLRPDPDTNLGEYGFNSIHYTRLCLQINRQYGLELTPLVFFQFKTIHRLATWLLEAHNSPITRYYAAQAENLEGHGGSQVAPVRPTLALPSCTDAEMNAEAIAIIGMHGLFPGSQDLDAFWQQQLRGESMIREIPADRWDWHSYQGDPTREANATRAKWGGFIDGIDQFDARFFNISPKEAQLMDPQFRLFLQCVWLTMEDAGYSSRSLKGTATGVFAGVSTFDYFELITRSMPIVETQLSTGNSRAMLANRVSYYLDLHGPSLSLDTACSSSLVAVHRAAESIRRGECAMAFAGGVNALLSPSVMITLDKGGMLSTDGVNRPFDAAANGYVRGEGVGVVLLKSLSRAVADGDPIHAVIRASAENHGGRAASLTAPNPEAQTAVLVEAWSRAGVSPETIGYIETHGTSTPLGDPTEVNGLKEAFATLYRRHGLELPTKKHCALGAVKANIGHLEAAAGIAGLIKTVLVVQQSTIPPIANLQTQNPLIDLRDTCLTLPQQTLPWPIPNGPRRAGVSSFGFGGANVHLALESYERPLPPVVDESRPRCLVLSARTQDRLPLMARQLSAYLQRPGQADIRLADIATTLHHGRDHMGCRVAFVARSVGSLCSQLEAFADGRSGEGVFTPTDKPQAVASSDGTTARLETLVRRWVNGEDLQPDASLCDNDGRRISLPTYPFAGTRHWLPHPVHLGATVSPPVSTAKVGPLLDENISVMGRICFRTRLAPDAFFLKDHVVAGIKILPGVASLELAAEAVRETVAQPVCGIRNCVWPHPIHLRETALDIVTTIQVTEGQLGYAITSGSTHTTVHAQGEFILGSPDKQEPVDLAILRHRCARTLEAQEAYQHFANASFHYGPTLQVLHSLWIGEGEALTRLQLPVALEQNFAHFHLHPALMDGALQSMIGTLYQQELHQSFLPFSLGELIWHAPLARDCYAHVQLRELGDIIRADIRLLGTEGEVLVELRDYLMKPFRTLQPATALHFVEPHWQPMPAASESGWPTGGPVLLLGEQSTLEVLPPSLPDNVIRITYGKTFRHISAHAYVIDPHQPEAIQDLISALAPGYSLPAAVVLLASSLPADAPHAEELLPVDLRLWIQMGQYLQTKTLSQPLPLLYIVPESGTVAPEHSAIAAFLRSLSHEHSKLISKTIRTDAATPLRSILEAELADLETGELRYRDGLRENKQWCLSDAPSEQVPLPLRQGGVYLISGGAGGIGSMLARQLLDTFQATVIVCGRGAQGNPQLNDNPRYQYRRVDVTDKAAVTALIEQIIGAFGNLHGVIHAAGSVDDGYLANKSTESFRRVVAAKVSGLRHLDAATRGQSLDFFVCLSSLSSQLGAAGQTDYAYANRFLDDFMTLRSRQYAGRSLSLNLPLVAGGGMQVNDAQQTYQATLLGAEPLSFANLWRAFTTSLRSAQSPLLVFQADSRKLATYLQISSLPAQEQPLALSNPDESQMTALTALLRPQLLSMIASLLQIDAGEIETDVELHEYGFDSINFTEFTNTINDTFALGVNPSIFFEYPTVEALTAGLLRDHRPALESHFAGNLPQTAVPPTAKAASNEAVATPVPSTAPPVLSANPALAAESWPVPPTTAPAANPSAVQPIAIVGLDAVLPQSEDPETFWHNLLYAPDMISEAPADRWDWRTFSDNQAEDIGPGPRWGGFLQEIDTFDASFFNISNREARLMDPQHRLFLQSAWHALEDAGTNPETLRGRDVGVFVGVASTEYATLLNAQGESFDPHIATGLAHSMLANRLSYLLDLHGPSEAIDTACSSSLVAICRAVDAIRNGDCSSAIAGGVNVMIDPATTMLFAQGKMLSPDGRCRTFDAQAQGYVRGEGVGVVYLKPLHQAEADGDSVYAVIRGHAVNHGGRTQSITAPSVNAQADLIVRAWQRSGLDPRTVSYIETHGTATALGDPVEINALKKAFKALSAQAAPTAPFTPHCLLGSVKANIGHLESAAGIAGVIKVLLAMKHETLPGHPHFQQINPYISLDDSPFAILAETRPWTRPQTADGREINRRAGVSSFGFGGVNAHLVLEEHRPRQSAPAATPEGEIVLLSAKTAETLKEYVQELDRYLDAHPELSLASIAYTTQVGRPAFAHRLGILCDSVSGLREKLASFLATDGNMSEESDTMAYGLREKTSLETLLLDDADARDVFTETALRWYRKGKYEKMLQLWVRGATFDWSACYPSSRPLRISLPGYPFRKTRYWIESTQESPAVSGLEKATIADLALREYLRKIEDGSIAPDRVSADELMDHALLDFLKDIENNATKN